MTNDDKVLAILEKQGKSLDQQTKLLDQQTKVLEKLQSDVQDLKKGQDRSEKRLDSVEEVLTTLQQGQKRLEEVDKSLLKRQEHSEQIQISLLEGQKQLEQIMGQHTTILKALSAAQQDNSQELAEQFDYIKNLAVQLKHLRAVVATKPELDLTMEMAIKEINARIDLAVISLAKKVQSHERRLNNADIPNPDKH